MSRTAMRETCRPLRGLSLEFSSHATQALRPELIHVGRIRGLCPCRLRFAAVICLVAQRVFNMTNALLTSYSRAPTHATRPRVARSCLLINLVAIATADLLW